MPSSLEPQRFVFIGGMMVGRRMCRKFCEAFEAKTGHSIQLFTYKDALKNHEQFVLACDGALVITHSAGNVLLEKFACKPRAIRMFSPPSDVSAPKLLYRLAWREIMRFGRHDSVIWGWYWLTLRQALTLPLVVRYIIADQTQRIGDWQILVPSDDPLFPAASYPAELRRSARFTTLPGHHEALYFDTDSALEMLKF